MPQKKQSVALRRRLYGTAKRHRACNINSARSALVTAVESHTLFIEGADLSRLRLRSRTGACVRRRVRVREGGQLPLDSPCKNSRMTDAISRLDAWRAWTGPPQGASTDFSCRPLPNPVHDRRKPLHSPMTATQASRPPRAARRRALRIGFVSGCTALRHLLEDGVENAEAPSSYEGPTHRIFSSSRCILASASNGMALDTALAPKTDAASKYDLKGL